MTNVEGFAGQEVELQSGKVVFSLGGELKLDDATQAQLRQIACRVKVGSGVWRAGAKKSELIAALEAHVAGVEFDYSISQPVAPAKSAEEQKQLEHKDFEALLRVVQAGVPAYLAGPAGSGKTTAASKVAKRLGLPFYPKSVGIQTSEVTLLGYCDANGEYVRTGLREAFEHGGVYLLDEIDAGSPAVLVVLNSLIGNRYASFPDKVVEAHPDFRIVAGANTFGTGASREYVGRQQLDASTLDRFAFLEWGYDGNIERVAAGLPAGKPEKSAYRVVAGTVGGEELEKWHTRVVSVRANVAAHKVRHVVSPRASIYGVALLKAGLAFESVEKVLLKKGLADDVWGRIAC